MSNFGAKFDASPEGSRKMDLQRAIEAGFMRYGQSFLVVHVVTGAEHESFMATRVPGGFPEYDCYDVPTLVGLLGGRAARPAKIGVANSPFASVSEWSELR